MKAAALLIIMLSNEGHWLSGTEGQVALSWAADAAATPCDLIWELKLGDTRLGGDRVAIGPGQSPVAKVACPEVRARLALQWNWRLVKKQDAQEIAKGSEKLVAYPADLTSGWAELLKDKRIVVVDQAIGIPALLEKAKIKHTRLDHVAKLQTATADIVIVGPDIFRDKLFEQAPLQGLLETGTAVVVFRQTRTDRLVGFDIAARSLPEKLAWPTDEPLLRGFDAEDLQSWERDWRRGESKELRALRVPENAMTDSVVSWPVKPQAGGQPLAALQPALDSLLVSRSGGKGGPGRLVLCQMPLGDWNTDPRSQIFLGNVLDVMISPPSPRPAPAQPSPPPATGRPRSTITISPGDSP